LVFILKTDQFFGQHQESFPATQISHKSSLIGGRIFVDMCVAASWLIIFLVHDNIINRHQFGASPSALFGTAGISFDY